ncbi:dihydrofolate reductase family protein [Halomicroarcula sp. GCM10025324]|uniref:dihydrofolate reductase family protein n=1 Tax=Haloarcula TaxID=2237 RepID=UPI0023E78CDB|nr:dihydrofolate reductase family protein [Halomicroarcula sp. ZS-22-S1]
MTDGRSTLYIATSVDGYVATPDGGVEWLDAFQTDAESDVTRSYEAFYETVDCLVMGSTTYEQILGFGDWPYDDRPTYVVTSRDLPLATAAVELVDGDLDALVTDLKRQYDHVWLVGGAQLARAFFALEQVDRLRLTLAPVLLGEGIRLFEDGERTDLQHAETTTYENGLVELAYDVDA